MPQKTVRIRAARFRVGNQTCETCPSSGVEFVKPLDVKSVQLSYEGITIDFPQASAETTIADITVPTDKTIEVRVNHQVRLSGKLEGSKLILLNRMNNGVRNLNQVIRYTVASQRGYEKLDLKFTIKEYPLHQPDEVTVLRKPLAPINTSPATDPIKVAIQVDTEGKVVDTQILDRKTDAKLGEAVKNWIFNWQFKPLLEDDEPRPFTVGMTIHLDQLDTRR
jgi:TonB family protein